MRWFAAFVVFVIASMIIVIVGVGFVAYALTLPVYTVPEAWKRVTAEVENLPESDRTAAWYARLRALETPHKLMFDFGRGLIAAGIGLFGAMFFWVIYNRIPLARHVAVLFLLWVVLWLVRLPLTLWYYKLRLYRDDYPPWGDSVIIPIFVEWVTWIIGAIVTSAVLALLLIRHPLPEKIGLSKPRTLFSWLRAGFISSWFALLVFLAILGVPEGDEALVLTSTLASAILLVFLSARDRATARHYPDSLIGTGET